MSVPRIIAQILIIGGRIVGKAFYEAGKQAVKNAQHRPNIGSAAEATGVQNATSGSLTDKLTREHKMTADEARLILSIGRNDGIESMVKHFDHLIKANSPKPPPEGLTPAQAARIPQQHTSQYLLAKVVRARERLEAEMVVEAEEVLLGKEAAEGTKPPPPSG